MRLSLTRQHPIRNPYCTCAQMTLSFAKFMDLTDWASEHLRIPYPLSLNALRGASKVLVDDSRAPIMCSAAFVPMYGRRGYEYSEKRRLHPQVSVVVFAPLWFWSG